MDPKSSYFSVCYRLTEPTGSSYLFCWGGPFVGGLIHASASEHSGQNFRWRRHRRPLVKSSGQICSCWVNLYGATFSRSLVFPVWGYQAVLLNCHSDYYFLILQIHVLIWICFALLLAALFDLNLQNKISNFEEKGMKCGEYLHLIVRWYV